MKIPSLPLVLSALGLTVGLGGCAATSTDPVGSIYVAPSGDDANSGTSSHPLKTLEQARDRVRALIPFATGDITVYLQGGVYRLSRPLLLGEPDSGANGHRVIYAAAPGQQPIISGGAAVTGWKLVDAGKNLWMASAPAGLQNTRQLFVNGVRATRASGRVPVKLTET